MHFLWLVELNTFSCAHCHLDTLSREVSALAFCAFYKQSSVAVSFECSCSCSKFFLPTCSSSVHSASHPVRGSDFTQAFPFMGHVFGVLSKNSLLNPRSKEFSPLCPSLFHQICDAFQLIFYKIQGWGRFVYLDMDVHFFRYCFLKSPSFLY